MNVEKYPCVILCGGGSKRFGGHKISAMLGGKPILHHVINRVSTQCSHLALNHLHRDMWLGKDLPNLMDDIPNMGPLSGVLTAMQWAKQLGQPRVLTTPADTPFLPLDWATKLDKVSAKKIAIPEVENQTHRVSSLWPTALYDELLAFLTAGHTNKVSVFLETQNFQNIPFPKTNTIDPFLNINTREDLKQAESFLIKQRPPI